MQEESQVSFALSYNVYCNNYQRRMTLRKKNLQVLGQSQEDQQNGIKKTAQIKSIQKFIGKLKMDNKNYQAILGQIDSFNLLKYLQEISNIIALSINQREIVFYTEVNPQHIQIATKLNLSYNNFPKILLSDLQKYFTTIFQSQQENISKLKTLLMYTTQLYVCGFAFSYKVIMQFLKKIFQSGNKRKNNYKTQIQKKLYIFYNSSDSFASFLIQYTQVFTKRSPKWIIQWEYQNKDIKKLPQSVPVKIKQQLSAFFLKYIIQTKNILNQSFEKIKEYQGALRQNLKLDGQFNKQLQKKYNEIILQFTITRKNLLLIANALNQQIQDIKSVDDIIDTDIIIKQYVNTVQDAQIFQDQFQKQIYQNLLEFTQIEVKNTDNDYKDFKQKLQNCKNVSDADQIIKEFSKINNKKNRKLLAKDILEYRKQYQLVTPYLCRIVATIYKSWKDIGDIVTQMLTIQYQKLKQSTNFNFVINDKKSRNFKYLCQLTKFKVFDPDKMMGCIKNLIDDLKGHNIQLLISTLQSVGRFLYLSPNSANKFTFLLSLLDNAMNKKSLPVFTTSQLINSINLLKPRQDNINKKQIIKTQIQLKVQDILNQSIIDDLEKIVDDIKDILKIPSGLETIKKELLLKIQEYQFLGNYNFAYMLDYMNNDQINQYICKNVQLKLQQAVLTGKSQKGLYWSRFYAQLYKYGLFKRATLYEVISNLLKLQASEINIINAICTIFTTCQGYLDCKKVGPENQRFMILLQFKKFINQCSYVPMLEQFNIVEVFDFYQPNLIGLNNIQIESFMKDTEGKEQYNLSRQLNEWVEINNLKETKKTKDPMIDTRDIKVETVEEKDQIQKKQHQTTLSEYKSFDQQFKNIIDVNIRDYSSRIAKPIFVQRQIERKKQKKQKTVKNEKEKCITIIGRTGNRYIKKDIIYKDDNMKE